MAKIPVEKTISETYGFFFKNILSVIGIVWFPYLVFGGIAGALVWLALGHASLDQLTLKPDQLNVGPMLALMRLLPAIVFCLITAVLIATVGLTRKALGLMKGPTFIFFTLGAPLWRLWGAIILIEIIAAAVCGAFVLLAVAWVKLGVPHVPQPAAALVAVLGVTAMVCWFVYMLVRLWFFVPAVVVAEDKIGLARSWQLGGGNFWRMVVLFLMVVLPPAILLGLLQNVVTTILYGPMPLFVGPHTDPKQFVDVMRAFFFRIGPVFLGFQLLIAIVTRALYAGAVANAYRGVTAAAPVE
jgi:hypothetical protein